MDSDDIPNTIYGHEEDHPFFGLDGLERNNFSIHKDYIVTKDAPTIVKNQSQQLTLSNASDEIDHFCKEILYIEIGSSRVRIWDLLLLLPVLIFMSGLLIKLNTARLKLKAVPSPIYSTFYFLIWLNVFISLIRCIVSMSVNAATVSGDEANIILYIGLRFFLLATEMSVVTFAILFGHLDNRTSIRRVLAVTCMIALPYAILQSFLELFYPDTAYFVDSKDYQLFAHGGSVFFLASSITFTVVYCFLLLLKLDCVKRRFIFLLWMPTKGSFYLYLSFLGGLNALQSIGCALYVAEVPTGLCIIDLTTWIYFSLLTPLIYFIFVHKFFRSSPVENVENIVFSYRSEEEDTVSIPATQPDAIADPFQNPQAYSSLTEEDTIGTFGTNLNPLDNAVLQSPDSITGQSINSCESFNQLTTTRT